MTEAPYPPDCLEQRTDVLPAEGLQYQVLRGPRVRENGQQRLGFELFQFLNAPVFVVLGIESLQVRHLRERGFEALVS